MIEEIAIAWKRKRPIRTQQHGDNVVEFFLGETTAGFDVEILVRNGKWETVYPIVN